MLIENKAHTKQIVLFQNSNSLQINNLNLNLVEVGWVCFKAGILPLME